MGDRRLVALTPGEVEALKTAVRRAFSDREGADLAAWERRLFNQMEAANDKLAAAPVLDTDDAAIILESLRLRAEMVWDNGGSRRAQQTKPYGRIHNAVAGLFGLKRIAERIIWW